MILAHQQKAVGGPNRERSMLETREGVADVFGWSLKKKPSSIRNTNTITLDEKRSQRYNENFDRIDWSK